MPIAFDVQIPQNIDADLIVKNTPLYFGETYSVKINNDVVSCAAELMPTSPSVTKICTKFVLKKNMINATKDEKFTNSIVFFRPNASDAIVNINTHGTAE